MHNLKIESWRVSTSSDDMISIMITLKLSLYGYYIWIYWVYMGILMDCYTQICVWIFLALHRQLDMMTSSNGNIFRVTGPLYGEFTGHRWIPRTQASSASFDIFFDLRLNKPLIKQSWGWWFETPSCSLWRHCNGNVCSSPIFLEENVMILSSIHVKCVSKCLIVIN